MNRSLKGKLLSVLQEGYCIQTWRAPSYMESLRMYSLCLNSGQKIRCLSRLLSILSGLIIIFLYAVKGFDATFEYPVLFVVFGFSVIVDFLWFIFGIKYPKKIFKNCFIFEQRKRAKDDVGSVFNEFLFIGFSRENEMSEVLSRHLFCDIMLGLNGIMIRQLCRRAGQLYVRQEISKQQGCHCLGIDTLREHLIQLAECAQKCGIVKISSIIDFVFKNKIVYHGDWSELGAKPPEGE